MVLEYRDTSSGVNLIVARLCLCRQCVYVSPGGSVTYPVATTGGRVMFTPAEAQREGVLV